MWEGEGMSGVDEQVEHQHTVNVWKIDEWKWHMKISQVQHCPGPSSAGIVDTTRVCALHSS